ncbi:MAG TPA: hypothetical protein DCO83_09115 [Mucilaginibacter sp.]|nr:hypothetical protein [Mucilaginibacter sp.]
MDKDRINLSLRLSGLRKGERIKPWAYKAFVVTEKIKQQLKPKQQQAEQIWLWSLAYVSFAGSFKRYYYCFLNFVQIIALIFTYARKT